MSLYILAEIHMTWNFNIFPQNADTLHLLSLPHHPSPPNLESLLEGIIRKRRIDKGTRDLFGVL